MKQIYRQLWMVLFLGIGLTEFVCAKSKTESPSKTENQSTADNQNQPDKTPPPLDLSLPADQKQGAPTSIAGANSNASAALPVASDEGIGMVGNFYHRAKLTGALSIGGNFNWKPYSYFFIRGGADYRYIRGEAKYDYYPNKQQFSYSWGIGYDDWHPGTFSAQLNNWGPIFPRNGLDFKKAIANIGYKFEAEFLKPYNITGSVAMNIPVKDDPSISTTWIWSPIEHWFIRASLQRKFGSKGGWDWSYNFGYFDWHPFTFSITYDNWGKNQIFDGTQADSFNFKEKGAVSLSWSWAF